MNKRILGIVGALAIAAVSGVSCAKSETYVYFGLGNYAKAGSKVVATGDTASADVYAAAVLFDQDGKIVDVNIDAMQPGVKATLLTAVETSAAATKMNATGDYKSKWDLGDAYGMKAATANTATAIHKEWYEQMDAHENWAVGKTIEDIKGVGYKIANSSHTYVFATDAIKTSVSITTENYIDVIERAWKNKVAVKVAKVADVRVGLGMVSALDAKQINVTVAGALFGKDDKVVAGRHDVYQIPLTIAQRVGSDPAIFDVAINVVNKKQIAPGSLANAAVVLSKHDLGPVYGMYYQAAYTSALVDKATVFFNGKVYERKGTTGAGEWYEQANKFVAYLVGKTVAAVAAGVDATTEKLTDLTIGVTITASEYVAAYAEAFTVAESATR